MKKLFLNFKKQLLHHLPCLICLQPTRTPFYLCKTCFTMLPRLPPYCPQCFSLKHSFPLPGCREPFRYISAAYAYQGHLKNWILQLKFHHQLFYAHLIGTLLGHHLIHNYPLLLPEIILPVPLHKFRLQERGFNQSYWIAKTVQQYLPIPIDYKILEKIKETPPQSSLPLSERRKNLHKAFQVYPNNYRRVALVDDVFTTGTTLRTLAIQLRNSGVISVDAWCFARSIHVL